MGRGEVRGGRTGARLAESGSARARHFASGVPEYITDLRFGLVDKKGYKPEQWLFAVKRRLHFMGLDARIAFARKASTYAGWVKVTGLLAETGLAPIDAAMCQVKLMNIVLSCQS